MCCLILSGSDVISSFVWRIFRSVLVDRLSLPITMALPSRGFSLRIVRMDIFAFWSRSLAARLVSAWVLLRASFSTVLMSFLDVMLMGVSMLSVGLYGDMECLSVLVLGRWLHHST